MSDTAVNSVSDASIYLGLWTNWSHGTVRGATITLTKRDGGLLIAFLALFISTVTADEVLISSPKCGQLMTAPIEDFYLAVQPYSSKLTTASAAYAQQCYGSTTAKQECSVFVKKQIPQIVSSNATCPFPGQEKICMRSSTNLRIDSGMIDSHKHFGINSAPEDRFTYRNVLECGPLRTKGFTQTVSYADNPASNLSVNLLYGSQGGGIHVNDSVTWDWPIDGPQTLKEYEISLVHYLHSIDHSLIVDQSAPV
ncbi:MAG: hypothetical protein Q9227_001701 [Pyrenula ochraceoflavens]